MERAEQPLSLPQVADPDVPCFRTGGGFRVGLDQNLCAGIFVAGRCQHVQERLCSRSCPCYRSITAGLIDHQNKFVGKLQQRLWRWIVL